MRNQVAPSWSLHYLWYLATKRIKREYSICKCKQIHVSGVCLFKVYARTSKAAPIQYSWGLAHHAFAHRNMEYRCCTRPSLRCSPSQQSWTTVIHNICCVYLLMYSIDIVLSSSALCRSASISVSAALSVLRLLHSDASHIFFNLSRAY